ncbi:MAG: 5-formyltetrahydrofolate cyclo-ligase [Rickettsiales bacterium]|nr:5-formyltetrahydrofolate cyclo-ligase [Rickettsiales bacterium]
MMPIKITEAKKILRKTFREKRAQLNDEEVKIRSNQINLNFLDNLLPKIYQKNSKKIFSLYQAMSGEVDCQNIANFFEANSILFSFPKIIDENLELIFIQAKPKQELEPNKFFPKILEISAGEKIFPDFLIIPLLAFDKNLNRLGMGKGFFDRTINFLKKRNLKIITIGLAYDFQRYDDILPCDKTDQRLDFIVTEKNIFSAN